APGDGLQHLAPALQDASRARALRLDDGAHLFVDRACRLLAEVARLREHGRPLEVAGRRRWAVGQRAELLAHAEARHHLARGLAGALEVVLRAGRDVLAGDL